MRGADVTASLAMLDMEMGQRRPIAWRRRPPAFSRTRRPALVMVGHWGLAFEIQPPGSSPSTSCSSTRPTDAKKVAARRPVQLFAALVSLALGAAACLVVVLFAQSVLG